MKKFALVIFFLLITVWIYASDGNVERQSLKGLKGLEVVSRVQSNVSLPGFKEAPRVIPVGVKYVDQRKGAYAQLNVNPC